MIIRKARMAWTGIPVLALIAALSAAEDVRKTIQPDDIVNLRTVQDPRISPDGKHVLFTVGWSRAAGEPEVSVIYIVPADGTGPARPFILGNGTDASPRWSPDGRTVAFISNRNSPLAGDLSKAVVSVSDASPAGEGPVAEESGNRERSRQVWTIPASGGEAVPLTSLPGDVSQFEWSPDGREIALLVPDPETEREKADRLAKRDWIEVDKNYKLSHLWICDLDSRTAKKESLPGLNISGLEWSPDGRRMALRIADSPTINDYFYHSRIVLFDPETGELGRVISTLAASGLRWSPDGSKIAYNVIGADGITSTPFVCEVGSGAVANPAPDYPGLIGEMEWSADSKALIAQAFEGAHFAIVRIDPKSSSVRPIAVSGGQGSQFSVSRDDRRVAFTGSTPGHPEEVWLAEGGKVRVLTDFNPGVGSWALGSVREMTWTNSKDGARIYGVLVTPPGYKEGIPVKTIVQIHGGPEWAWWSGWLGSWHEWAQMLASHGYAVFLPNPRGSDGQGAAFARAVVKDWGGGDFQDIMDGVDSLVKAGIADPARLAIGGWSYGGFMSLWAVTHTDRFKTAIVGAGVSDLLSLARITDTPDFPLGYYGDVPSNISLYDAHSPIRLLERVNVPLLVLHGEADTRVPISQGEALYVGLRMLGKPVRMVRYPREPHWFREKEHQSNILEQVLTWYDSHL